MYNPIRYVPRGKIRGQRFPEIWMLLPVHGMTLDVFVWYSKLLIQYLVLGLQYYHIAKIVLTISSCPSPMLGYETLKQSRNIEVGRSTLASKNEQTNSYNYTQKNIRNHLLTILGLTKSNSKAENSLFTARHCLVTCLYPRNSWSPLILILIDSLGGWVLRNRLDQEAAENMLLEMETTTGWNTKPYLQSLREQWHDENSDDWLWQGTCSNQLSRK